MVQSKERPHAPTPLLVLLAVILACTVGCFGRSEVPLYPVQGQVTVEKVPLTSGIVGLVPDADHGNTSRMHTWGTLDDKGTYSVFTEGRPGAPVGAYKVIVILNTPPEEPNVPLPNAKYKTAETTDERLDVMETPSPGAYDLHLKH
jgi:hypothetical protein